MVDIVSQNWNQLHEWVFESLELISEINSPSEQGINRISGDLSIT